METWRDKFASKNKFTSEKKCEICDKKIVKRRMRYINKKSYRSVVSLSNRLKATLIIK